MVRPPFFIYHDSRSGSTFLADRLIKGSDCSILPESNFLLPILRRSQGKRIEDRTEFEELLQALYREEKFRDWAPEKESLRSLWSEEGVDPARLVVFIAEQFDPQIGEGIPWGFKKGNYAFHFQLIDRLFPQAKHLYLIRDGRAIFASKKRNINPDLGKPFETHPEKAAKTWVKYQRAFGAIKQRASSRSYSLYYEQLLKDLEGAMEALLAFLGGIPRAEDEAEGFFIPERYQEIHQNVDRPAPSSQKAKGWRQELSEEELLHFEKVAYEELQKAGYELVNSKRRLFFRKWFSPFWRTTGPSEENGS